MVDADKGFGWCDWCGRSRTESQIEMGAGGACGYCADAALDCFARPAPFTDANAWQAAQRCAEAVTRAGRVVQDIAGSAHHNTAALCAAAREFLLGRPAFIQDLVFAGGWRAVASEMLRSGAPFWRPIVRGTSAKPDTVARMRERFAGAYAARA